MASEYWKDRQASAQAALTKKNIKETEKQLIKYYDAAMKRVGGGFLSTYNKVMRTIEKGKEATPADLYKLDAYWKLQADLAKELERLGDKQAALYRKQFVKQWHDIYDNIAVKDDTNFHAMTDETALQMISEIWCADGKSWSARVWQNTNLLQQTLNDELIHCLLTGQDERYLRQMLMYEFNVSYNNADMLIKTEMAHIQTKAAAKRYEDSGIKQFEVWADEDERRCDICGALHQKRYFVGEHIPIPAHPRCRCCIVPVIE